MKTNNCSLLFLVIITIFFPSILSSQFNLLETNNLQLIYFDPHIYVVPHLTRCFENALQFHRKLFDYTPSEKVSILLNDFDDYGSGGTSAMPWNYISVGIEPFDYVYDTRPTNERMNWLMNHEIVHLVATDQASRADKFYRTIFGGKVVPTSENPTSMIYSYLTTPRWYAPRWYHEGIATFLETWMAGGIGRVLGGYDEMVFRTMVHEQSHFYDFVGIESEGTTIDFQIGANAYLYGTRFVSYLADQYSPEKVLAWFKRTDESKRYYASQFENIFGSSLDDEWTRWIAFEQKWQESNLQIIRQHPVTKEKIVYENELGSVSRSFFDSSKRTIYVAVNYPKQIAHIAAINVEDGTLEKICNITTPTLYYVSSLAYDPSSSTLFYTTNNSRSWRDIWSVHIPTHTTRLLLKDVRIGDLVFNQKDTSLWGVQHHNGLSKLVRIPYPYQNYNVIYSLPYGKDIFDIDISSDGTLLSASFIEVSGRQQLVKGEIKKLLNKEEAFEVIHEFENNSPSNFAFSSDGKYLFGTSYFTGVSNVFRYDLQEKKMESLTNVETGYFRPLPISSDSLIVFRYKKNGFQPVMIHASARDDVPVINYLGQQIVEKHPVVTSWVLGSPARINIDSVTTSISQYNSFANMNLASLYPIVEGYKDFPAYGLRMSLLDRIGVQSLDLTASYSPNKLVEPEERFHALLNYDYWDWNINASYNRGDFYDLFGPTKTSRKGYSVGLGYSDYLIYDQPNISRYSLRAVYYGGLEKLPEYQNITVSFDKFLVIAGNISYSYSLSTLGSVEPERGFRSQLSFQNIFVRKKRFPHFVANVDYGFQLPNIHSTLWLRSSFGYSLEERGEPFANFYFGGYGNNWVDYQDARRYREYYSFPGVELNEIHGTNYGKLMLEWVTPPLRFRRAGIPNFYCTYTQLVLFSQGIISNMDIEERSIYGNIGAQLDFKIVLFSLLESTFSLGYAIAAEKYQRQSKEFMISLKILR